MASADRLIAVFNEATAWPVGAERERLLAKACAGDLELREHVLSLLHAHERAGDFLKNTQAISSLTLLTEKPGDRIGRYKLLEQIGEGGCGVVYMAEQQEPVRRRVAFKIIKPGMDTKQVIARFEAERQALALMDHQNIAKVLDAGATHTGRPFFVMELVRGIKITDYCDQNQFSTTERLELFIQVCQAIQHAHQKGVIHRDLKPSNILVAQHDSAAVPKVIDFGIAKATAGQQLTDKTVFTAFEQFIGTPAYMSPEQAQLSGLDVDTRTDIYALGVLLYELLTGRTPFDQKALLAAGLDEMRRTIREREPPKPSTCLSTLVATELSSAANRRQTEPPKLLHLIRGDLDWIVMKALEKDRTRRYETANGLGMDVRRHLKNEPVSARPPSNLYRLQKLVQRNRLAFVAGAAVVAATLLALSILVTSNLRITRESKARIAALNAAQTSEQRAKEQLFLSLKSQAQARRYSRQMGQRLESLAALAEAARLRVDPDLRDEAIAAMALPDVRRGPKWQIPVNRLAYWCDPDYRHDAVFDRQRIVTVRSIPETQELHRLGTASTNATGPSTILTFSPDGRFLAKAETGHRLRVWRLEDAELAIADMPANCSVAAFSPNSRHLVAAQQDWILSFDLDTGREQTRWQTAARIHALSFSPDNRRIAVGYTSHPRVSVYDVNGRELAHLPVEPSMRSAVCWHPDGKRLAVGGSDPRIQMWEVDGERKLVSLEGHVQEVSQLSFHPSGELLASGSWDGVMRLWEVATGRVAMQLPVSANLGFSKDGRWLGFFSADANGAQLLEVVLSHEYQTLKSASGGVQEYYDCAVSPDNRLLAAGMQDGTRLWDLTARRELAFLPSGFTASALFISDGQELLTSSPEMGLQRWPIHKKDATHLQIGSSRRVALPFAPNRISQSADERTVAICSESSGEVAILDLKTESIQKPVRHSRVSYVALSSDARWLATSGWQSDRVRLWNVQSGQLIHELPGSQTRVSFTPDSRFLIVARSQEFSFLDVQTLQTSRRLSREIGLYAGEVAFSPDEKLMAMEMVPGVIHLKEVATSRTIAKFQDPHGDRTTWLGFTPDGTQLIVLANWAPAIHVWDLRAIRAGLKPMGLDWDWPEFPPVSKSDESRASLTRTALKIELIAEKR